MITTAVAATVAPAQEATEGQARDAITYRIARITFFLNALLLLPALAGARSQLVSAPDWWAAISAVVLGVTIVVLLNPGAAARLRDPLWAVFPVLWAAASIAWTLLTPRNGAGPAEVPWTWTLSPLAITVAALRWRLVPAVAIGIAPPVVALLAEPVLGYGLTPALASDSALHLANVFFAVLVVGARDHLLNTWRTTRAVAAKEQQIVLTNALRAERDRLTALVHDHVLATLTVAGQNAAADPELAHAAAQSRELLITRRGESLTDVEVAGDDVVQRLADLCRANHVTFAVTGSPQETVLPGPTAQALLAATAQAIQNSSTHAGADARCQVSAHLSAPRVEVTVSDTGRGFDPAAIPSDRLGVRTSILARMEAEPGGSAQVHSEIGVGTTVTLSWQDPNDVTAETEAGLPDLPDIGVVSGIGTLGGRVTFLVGWLGGLAWVVLAWPSLPQPGLVVFAAIWMLIAIVVGTRPSVGIPTWGVPILALTPVITSTALLLQWHQIHGEELWLLQLGADVGAMLALRGRVKMALAGGLFQVLAVLWLTARIGVVAEGAALLMIPLITLTAGILLHRGLTRSLQANLSYRDAEARAQVARRAARQAAERAEAWLAQLSELAQPCLDELSLGQSSNPALRERCRNTAAAIRDLLRAPSLADGRLAAASADARARGVRVELFDDGHTLTPLRPATLEQLAEALGALPSGRATVRVLPPGRAKAVTAVLDDGTDVARLEFDG